MSYLTIVRRAAALTNLPRPDTVVGSTDEQVIQLGALANEEGLNLAQRHDWQALVRQHTFLTEADPDQTTAVPDDLDRFIYNSTYNRSTDRGVFGPITPQQWQMFQAYPQLSTVYLAFRMRDGAYLLTPDPPEGQTIAYEYVSKNWAISPSGTPQSEFLADADTTYLDESLIVYGIRWRFKAAKGLDYSEDLRTYERQVQQQAGRDGGLTALTIGYAGGAWLANIPDGNWPSA
jgi:hypothetical protein